MDTKRIDDKELLLFIKEVYTGLKKFGVGKVSEKIRELKIDKYDSRKQQLIDIILFKIYESYGISLNQLKSNKRGITAEARRMSFVLFKQHLDLSQAEISQFFNRPSRIIVSDAIKDFKMMSKNIKREREFLETFETINGSVNSFKEEMIKKYSKKDSF